MKSETMIPVFIFIAVAILVYGTVLLMNDATKDSKRRWDELDKKTYIAWCKLNEKEISFDDWKLLRQSGLLQGQKP